MYFLCNNSKLVPVGLIEQYTASDPVQTRLVMHGIQGGTSGRRERDREALA